MKPATGYIRFRRRVKATPPELTQEELQRYGRRPGAIENYTPVVPKIHFGKRRFEDVFNSGPWHLGPQMPHRGGSRGF